MGPVACILHVGPSVLCLVSLSNILFVQWTVGPRHRRPLHYRHAASRLQRLSGLGRGLPLDGLRTIWWRWRRPSERCSRSNEPRSWPLALAHGSAEDGVYVIGWCEGHSGWVLGSPTTHIYLRQPPSLAALTVCRGERVAARGSLARAPEVLVCPAEQLGRLGLPLHYGHVNST